MSPPKAVKEDALLTIARAGISAIPYLGGPAKELLALVIVPPLEQRRVQWMNRVAERLKQLEREVEGFRLENLKQNQLFLTAVLHATTAALRTHQEEKLQALQNAVLNSARGINIEENVQLLFLNAVDDLTPLHLGVLKYFEAPDKWLNEHGVSFRISMGGASSGLEAAFPGLRRETYDPIVTDLFNRGLLNADKTTLHTMMSQSGILSSRTTELGRQFLKYIEA